MAWYKEWFGAEYLEMYSHRDESEAEAHADFVERCLGRDGRRPGAVLDLACGAGRHTAVLRRRGYRTLGVDLSLTLLARMREQGLPRVAGDMRLLPFAPASFDWVLNFFTSFGYFESERENFRVLEEVVRVLAPGGRFLIDLMNPGPMLANLNPGEVQALDGREVEVERWYDDTKKRINKRIVVRTPGEPARTFLESVRVYQPEEVAIGLRWAGLEVASVYGNFQGEPYERDSERLILIGHKPA
jgi:SAM-dependent methyltransferase